MDKNLLEELIKAVTRVEIIEEGKGRTYVNFKEDNQVQAFLQDDGRTLKIFISEKQFANK